MKTHHLIATLALCAPLAALAEGDSPWLPIPGQLSLSVNLTQQSGDSAYIGSVKVPVTAITGGGASKFRRSSSQLRLGYGISDGLSLDATVGYGRARVGAADNDSGLTDSVLGLNWRVLDEFEQPALPTLTLRGALIFKGNYDGGRLAALGNDQNGFELAAVLGKQLTPALALWAELGVQNRSGAVPNATFYELGTRYRWTPQWSASLAYASKKYSGNLDIGGPGFTPARFQDVRAERGLVKLGLGYALAANQGLALSLTRIASGRNTVNDNSIVGVSYTFGF